MVTGIGTLFILGDSYSTFTGHIPQGYATYYKPEGPFYLEKDGEVFDPVTDVTDVTQTWWHQFLCETDAELLQNCSWSGTTVCNTGYGGGDVSHKSFIGRLDRLIESGYFRDNRVDTLIVFGGTNDTWANSPLGELKYSDWTREELYCVLPAIGYLFHRLSRCLPDTRVICVLNTRLKPEIEAGFVSACAHSGAETVVLEDIDKKSGHPTVLGMQQIKDQLLAYLMRNRK